MRTYTVVPAPSWYNQ